VAPWALASVGCDVSYVPSPIGPPGSRQFVYGTEGLPELGPGINFGTDQRQEGSLVNNDRENPLFHSENGLCLHGVCVLSRRPSRPSLITSVLPMLVVHVSRTGAS
jgi:hypothetical protein